MNDLENEIVKAIKKLDFVEYALVCRQIKKLDKDNFYVHFGEALLSYHLPSDEECIGKFGFFEDYEGLLSFNQSFIETIQKCIDYIDNDAKLQVFLDLYFKPIFTVPQSKTIIGVYVPKYNTFSIQRKISYYEYLLDKLPPLLDWLVKNIKSIQVDNKKLKNILELKELEFKKMMIIPENKHFKRKFNFVLNAIEKIINN